MADAPALTLADQVAALVAGGQYRRQFTPVRVYEPRLDREELHNLSVTVAAVGEEQTLQSRAGWQQDYTIAVAVQQAVAAEGEVVPGEPSRVEEIDDLLHLVEEIKRRMQGAAIAGASLIRLDNNPIWNPERLRQHVFTSVIAAVYRRHYLTT